MSSNFARVIIHTYIHSALQDVVDRPLGEPQACFVPVPLSALDRVLGAESISKLVVLAWSWVLLCAFRTEDSVVAFEDHCVRESLMQDPKHHFSSWWIAIEENRKVNVWPIEPRLDFVEWAVVELDFFHV